MEVTRSKTGLAAWVPLQHLTTASLGTAATPGREGERTQEEQQNRGKTISQSQSPGRTVSVLTNMLSLCE